MNPLLKEKNGSYRAELLIMIFSFLCWGRILSMSGIWWDDWAWVWHYFGSDNVNEFMLPFTWLKHRAVGYSFFLHFKLFEIFHEYTSNIWSVFRFIVFTANALLIHAISKNVLLDKVVLPVVISVIYLSSPVVDHLVLSTYLYHLFLSFYLLSIYFSVKSISGSKVSLQWYLPALLLSFISMASLESFIFLDFLRPILFIYLIHKRNNVGLGDAIKKSLLCWAPFFLIGAGILVEVALVPQTGAYADVYSTGPISIDYFIAVITRYSDSIEYLFFKVYKLTVKYCLLKDGNIAFILTGLISSVYVSLTLFKRRRMFEGKNNTIDALGEAKMVAIFGLIVVVVGLFPYALAREAVSYGHQSRYGLLAAIGTSIFFPSFFLALHYKKLISRKACQILLVVLVFLGSLQCNNTIGDYKETWEHQRSIWWQLIWRAPDMKPNTFMIIDMPWHEAPGGGSFVLPPALNLAYAESRDKENIFSHYAYEVRNAFRTDETNYREIYNKEIVEFQIYRGTAKLYPKNLIAASYQDGYLYLDSEIRKPVSSNWSDVEFMVKNAAKDRIIYEGAKSEFPYRWVLGKEFRHDWRYYYQKANALAGRDDYPGIVNLFNEAKAAGYDLTTIKPGNLMPFIEAFYLAGNLNMATSLLRIWSNSPDADIDRAVQLLGPDVENDIPALHKWIEKAIGHLSN
jgi:hypothetical protein